MYLCASESCERGWKIRKRLVALAIDRIEEARIFETNK